MRMSHLLRAASMMGGLAGASLLAQQATTGTDFASTVSTEGDSYVPGRIGGSSVSALRMTQPVIGKPYILIETTTREHRLPNGNTRTSATQRRSMRDADGRTRQEIGADGAFGFQARTVILDDPLQFTLTNINLTNHTATVSIYNRTGP